MTINWWTLGLQAVNVLVLVWLLSRVFWRPVAKAIATRQEAAQTLLADAKASKDKADEVLAAVTKSRTDMAAEREALLSKASNDALTEAKATLAKAAEKAETVLKTAQVKRGRDAEKSRANDLLDAADLAVTIAQKLLAGLETGEIQSVFLGHLITAIEQMTQKDREALVATEGGIELVSPEKLKAAEKAKMTKAIFGALGGKPVLNLVTDPTLIAGFELRTAHLVVCANWQSDLAAISKELENGA